MRLYFVLWNMGPYNRFCSLIYHFIVLSIGHHKLEIWSFCKLDRTLPRLSGGMQQHPTLPPHFYLLYLKSVTTTTSHHKLPSDKRIPFWLLLALSFVGQVRCFFLLVRKKHRKSTGTGYGYGYGKKLKIQVRKRNGYGCVTPSGYGKSNRYGSF